LDFSSGRIAEQLKPAALYFAETKVYQQQFIIITLFFRPDKMSGTLV
jgi:hypothetical protein